jgi:predicted ATP-grasp superfamily ATP-dependent carboligase
MSSTTACVIGEIDLVRALGLGGVRSSVVARPGDPARYSRFVDETIDLIDPWRHPQELVDELVRLGEQRSEPLTLFYDGDWDLLMVSRWRDRLRTAFRLAVADAELVENVVDKARFQQLAERLGLPVPRGAHLRASEVLPEELDLRFPVVVKPLTRQHATWRPLVGAKAFQVEGPTALRRMWPHLVRAAVDVLVQEVVPGPESAIESYHVYVDGRGEVAGEFTGRKIRTYPTSYGYTSALVVAPVDDVRSLGRSICEALRLRGVAKLDFKRGPDGLRLLEINPRFNLWHHPGAVAGVNLPALVHADLNGLDRQPAVQSPTAVRWCSPVRDRRAARADGMSSVQWARWAMRCETASALSRDDLLPFLGAGWWRIRRTMSRRLRSRARDARPGASRSPVEAGP